MLKQEVIDPRRPLLLLSFRKALFVKEIVLLYQNVRVALRNAETIASEFQKNLLRLTRIYFDLIAVARLWSYKLYFVEFQELGCFNVAQFLFVVLNLVHSICKFSFELCYLHTWSLVSWQTLRHRLDLAVPEHGRAGGANDIFPLEIVSSVLESDLGFTVAGCIICLLSKAGLLVPVYLAEEVVVAALEICHLKVNITLMEVLGACYVLNVFHIG